MPRLTVKSLSKRVDDLGEALATMQADIAMLVRGDAKDEEADLPAPPSANAALPRNFYAGPLPSTEEPESFHERSLRCGFCRSREILATRGKVRFKDPKGEANVEGNFVYCGGCMAVLGGYHRRLDDQWPGPVRPYSVPASF